MATTCFAMEWPISQAHAFLIAPAGDSPVAAAHLAGVFLTVGLPTSDKPTVNQEPIGYDY